MELEVGGGSVRRRQLSGDGRDAWAGLTLGAVLGNDKRPGPPVQVSRTLLDIIRDEEPNTGAYKNLINHHNNKKNWKSFKDRLRLRRAGNAWTSSVHTPTTDAATTAAMQISRSQLSRRNSTRMPPTNVPNSGGESAENASEQQVVCDYSTRTCGPQISRRNSSRIPPYTADSNQSPAGITEPDDSPVVEHVPVQNGRSLMLRRNSSRIPSLANQSTPSDPFNEYESTAAPSVRLSAALAAEREQIQRVVSSSEAAAEAERQNADEETAEEVDAPSTEAGQQPVRMSLMDLLEETDRQMGWVSYSAEDGEEEEEVEEESGDVHDQGGGGGGGGVQEYTCCVCMVRHKGAAFIPCGHTFCRLCSRELWVSRGNCPLCNGFILEILDIF